MSDCTERSEGQEGSVATPVDRGPNRINSVKRVTVEQERT
jgi:hypothetical protein